MRPAPTTAALLAVAILVAACGGATNPTGVPADGATAAQPTEAATTQPGVDDVPTPGTALGACEIVTAADIEAATGARGVAAGVQEATPTPLSPGGTECTYEGDWGRIIVSLTPEDGANLYDAARGSYKDAADIAGDWDGAFNSKDTNRAFVWKGAVTALFTMFLENADQLAVATALAKAVVAKL